MTPPDLASLQAEVLALLRSARVTDDAEFGAMALRLHDFQRRHNSVYARYCDSLGAPFPADWRAIPALPAAAFKRAEVRCFPPEAVRREFHTSGTTRGESGRHLFDTLDLYEAAILPAFRAALLPDGARLRMMVLTPPPGEAPHSSLTHMMETVIRQTGGEGSGFYFENGELPLDRLLGDLEAAAGSGDPVFLLGTAFAFVALLEELDRRSMRLSMPAGSRIMETGGFKGRTRDIPRPEFYARLSRCLAVPATHIVNEYGMTELSSQFYDLSMVRGAATDWKGPAPLARALIVDPLTGLPVPDGTRGLIRIVDLANVGSVIALQTEDVGIGDGGCFRVLGRVAAAPPRGCSLAAEGLVA